MVTIEPGGGVSRFTLSYVGAAGVEIHAALATAADHVAFEDATPVRAFPSYHGQRNYPGLWWAATMGRHVGFESWLERDHAMLLDFDLEVVGFASQPFWLRWRAGRRERSHAPDWFARRADGAGVVLDCRPLGRIGPRDEAAFAAMAAACEQVGWRYRLAGEPDAVQVANVRWLAGYRHPRHDNVLVAAAALEAFAQPQALFAGAAAVGDPIMVLPVIYYLLWTGRLLTDLTVPLSEHSLVRHAVEALG